jgi:hypothetical protein
VKRKGDAEELVSTFGLDDAKRAGLLGKQGPWQTSTKRMLKLRARGFALRDKFADVLAGLVSVEEALDLPRVEPDDPALTMLDTAQPLTLKDKLKAKVEQTEQPPAPPEPAAAGLRTADVLARSDDAQDTAEHGELPPSTDDFTLSNAVADHELAIDEAGTDVVKAQAVWNDVVNDERLTTADRSNLYHRQQKILKPGRVKK